MKKKKTEEEVENVNIEDIKEANSKQESTTPKSTTAKKKSSSKKKATPNNGNTNASSKSKNNDELTKKSARKKQNTEEKKLADEMEEANNKIEYEEDEIEDSNNEIANEENEEEVSQELDELDETEILEEIDDELEISEDELDEIIGEEDSEDDSFIINEETVQKGLDEIGDTTEEIKPQGKRIKIPLIILILVVLILLSTLTTLFIFKDTIFNRDANRYSNDFPSDDDMNNEELIGEKLIKKWFEGYQNTELEITERIFSYKINSVSLKEKQENKFIILATYDIVPASIDSSIWLAGNGEQEGQTIKNKSQYFVIESIENEYKITDTSTDKPDILNNMLTEEKAMLLIKNDFPDVDNLNLLADEHMINELTEEQKNSVISTVGGGLDNFYKISGSYRKTYILGTFLVNKENNELWFVDDKGITTKIAKATQILNLANFEVQGDLQITKEQAILTTFNIFPKNNRKSLAEDTNWINTIENADVAKQVLGEISEYYGLKIKDMQGIIAVNKNGLSKYYISPKGEVTELIDVEDVTTIIQ